MLLCKLFGRFIEQAPVCMAARAIREAALNPMALGGLFKRIATGLGNRLACCEEELSQERSLFAKVLALVHENDL